MILYPKIQSVFKRDPATKYKSFLIGEYSCPEFEYLQNNEWVFTEKVDGTNIRIVYKDGNIHFGGRTDNAQIPSKLANRLNEIFHPQLATFSDLFDSDVCLYGEGYGAGIQKGGGNYTPYQEFTLFDVRIGKWWLKRPDVMDIAEKLGLYVVPIVGDGTLHDMVQKVQNGIISHWGSFLAEGLIARPKVELMARNGKRIIAKLKTKDFRK